MVQPIMRALNFELGYSITQNILYKTQCYNVCNMTRLLLGKYSQDVIFTVTLTNKFKSLYPRGGKYEWEEILAFSHPQRILVSKIIV